jgi:predicted metal-dependent hydrolase
VSESHHTELPQELRVAPPLVFVRSARARSYRLTLRRDGSAAVTIPVRGSKREAWVFVEQHADWLARARARQARRPQSATRWEIGTPVLWRGELTPLRIARDDERRQVCLAADLFSVRAFEGDLRATLALGSWRRKRIPM